MEWTNQLDKVQHALQTAQNIVVIAHLRPDGDAVGSVLGLGIALQDAGHQVQMVLKDKVPSSLKFLVGVKQIVQSIASPYDFLIVVDSSDIERIGINLGKGTVPDLNIDHHATNLHFARINWVDEHAISTTAMLAEILPSLDLPITPVIASALLTGLITDSLGFRTPNMNAAALRTASKLVDAGANLPELYFEALTSRPYESARLWGIGLSNLHRKNDLIWTSISLAERRSVGYNGLDDADLVNFLPTISGVNIVVILLEQPDGYVKISWRSKIGYDISKLALQFGGGGHKNAAGAMLEGSLGEVQDQILRATLEHLDFIHLRPASA